MAAQPSKPGGNTDSGGGAGRPDMVIVDGRAVIGVCWRPGKPPTLICGDGDVDWANPGRYGIPVRYGDDVEPRAPRHFEWHRLGMADGEAVIEVRRADGMREVFRSRLVSLYPTGSTVQLTAPDGTPTIYGEDISLAVNDPIPTPDPRTPRWRRIVEDLHADISTGRLHPGDELLPVDRLARMYACSASTVHRALRRLTAEGLLAGRPGWGRFVTGPTTNPPHRPDRNRASPADETEPGVRRDRIGIKRRPGDPWHAITMIVTPHDTAAIEVSDADLVDSRAPNHLEARRLNIDPGEPVIEIRFADGTIEVYRSSRILMRADGDIHRPGGDVPAGTAFRTLCYQVTSPDVGPPFWRHLYQDIKTDITNGRLTTGAEIGTIPQLADMYILSSATIQEAMDRLRDEHLVQLRGDAWHVCDGTPAT